jgi:hypothetical protein
LKYKLSSKATYCGRLCDEWNCRYTDSRSISTTALLGHLTEVPCCAMSSPTETVTVVENQAHNVNGGVDRPQNVEPTTPTVGDALIADVRTLLETLYYGV